MNVVGDAPPFLLLGLDDVGEELAAILRALAQLLDGETELGLDMGPLGRQGDDVGEALEEADVVLRKAGRRAGGDGDDPDGSMAALDGHDGEARRLHLMDQAGLGVQRVGGDVGDDHRLPGHHDAG